MAMISRSLRQRLRKLEWRFGAAPEPIVHLIQFVDAKGDVTRTLTLDHCKPGVGEWWYAPGNDLLEPGAPIRTLTSAKG